MILIKFGSEMTLRGSLYYGFNHITLNKLGLHDFISGEGLFLRFVEWSKCCRSSQLFTL